MKTKIFFDTEFTGLHIGTTLISIGMVSDDGKTFYAEFNDYDRDQVTLWIQKNVINKLEYNAKNGYNSMDSEGNYRAKTDQKGVKELLEKWLAHFDEYEFWNDCLSYDWVLLSRLLGGLEGVNPDDDYYYMGSLCSLDKILGVDLDVLREVYGGTEDKRHNSLFDAMKMKECYEKSTMG